MATDLSVLRQRLQEALGSEFSVGTLLGQGGFAAVFRVRDVSLNRDVAVKVLDLELAPSPTLAERFVREAQTVARLEHPNIVPIYKVGKQRDVLYIVMRCVDGPSLRQLLSTHRRLSVGDAARIARQVADALAYAHSHGIVHRDVKPDNILLDGSGHVLVTDFGIAKAAQQAASTGAQLTTEGMIIGTPHYMSPEQAAGDQLDGRSDIYSLGIVLYQMLTGAPPFDGDSSASILAKQMTAAPAPIRQIRSDTSEELAAVLDRMLAKDPARRFPNAGEVSRALVGALPTAARDRVKVPLRRRLATMAIKSLVGLGLLGCLAGVAFLAGAAVVAFTVFSKPAKVSALAPLPDSLAQALRRQGALGRNDTAEYVFVPGGSEDSVLLVVGRRRVAVVTPGRVRSYARDSVLLGLNMDLRGGLQFRLVLRPHRGARDTVYRHLSFRDMFELAPKLERFRPEDAARRRVGVRSGATRRQFD
ncbi:MAG: serine/threonine-protein kinase [Gemmatimonadales bacterium]